MNKRALIVGLFYCLTAIALKLFILLGDYTITKFWFYFSNLITALLILPFYWIAIKLVRDKDRGGVIGGKEAVRISLTVLAIGILVLSVYNYIEFNWKLKEISIQYYNSNEYLAVLKDIQSKHPDKLKVEQFPEKIKEQIDSISASKATTGKIFPMLLIGLSGAFIFSILMKKRQPLN